MFSSLGHICQGMQRYVKICRDIYDIFTKLRELVFRVFLIRWYHGVHCAQTNSLRKDFLSFTIEKIVLAFKICFQKKKFLETYMSRYALSW